VAVLVIGVSDFLVHELFMMRHDYLVIAQGAG
jgi:hypothetical protein